MKLLLALGISLLLGSTAGCLLAFWMLSDYSSRWKPLRPAPTEVAQLVGLSPDGAYLQTASSSILLCGTDSACQPVSQPPDLGLKLSCSDRPAPFSPLAFPPRGIQQCVRNEIYYADYAWEGILVLDQDGKVWKWVKDRSGFDALAVPFFCLLGGFAGMFFGGLLYLAARSLRAITLKPTPPADIP